MEGENSPEYNAIRKNGYDLEEQMSDHWKTIARKLRDMKVLAEDQYDELVKHPNKCEMLVKSILKSIKVDPLNTFVKVVKVMKASGNAAFTKFVEIIEAKRKYEYRELLDSIAKPGASGANFQVFISYGREEKTITVVDQIAADLRQEGLEVFVDRSSLEPGMLWSSEMVGAIRSCKAFVAVLTNKYVTSKFCHGELYEAEAQQKHIYPVVMERGWNEQLAGKPIEEIVCKLQYSFFDSPEKMGDNSQQLIESIMKELGLKKPREGSDTYSAAGPGKITKRMEEIAPIGASQHSPQVPGKSDWSSRLLKFCQRFNLTIAVISKKVTDEHIKEVYPDLLNWERVAMHLGLKQHEIDDIIHRYPTDMSKRRHSMLKKWKTSKSEFGEATYGSLLQALLECTCTDSALKVCDLLKEQ